MTEQEQPAQCACSTCVDFREAVGVAMQARTTDELRELRTALSMADRLIAISPAFEKLFPPTAVAVQARAHVLELLNVEIARRTGVLN